MGRQCHGHLSHDRGKSSTRRRQLVHVRRLNQFVPVASQVIGPQGIDGDQNNIGPELTGWFLGRSEGLTNQIIQQWGKNDYSGFKHGSRQISHLIIHLKGSLGTGKSFEVGKEKGQKVKKELLFPFSFYLLPCGFDHYQSNRSEN